VFLIAAYGGKYVTNCQALFAGVWDVPSPDGRRGRAAARPALLLLFVEENPGNHLGAVATSDAKIFPDRTCGAGQENRGTVQAFYYRKRCLTAVAMGTDGISVSVAPVAHGGRERARPGRRFT
jgi:hypothetical protein